MPYYEDDLNIGNFAPGTIKVYRHLDDSLSTDPYDRISDFTGTPLPYMPPAAVDPGATLPAIPPPVLFPAYPPQPSGILTDRPDELPAMVTETVESDGDRAGLPSFPSWLYPKEEDETWGGGTIDEPKGFVAKTIVGGASAFGDIGSMMPILLLVMLFKK